MGFKTETAITTALQQLQTITGADFLALSRFTKEQTNLLTPDYFLTSESAWADKEVLCSAASPHVAQAITTGQYVSWEISRQQEGFSGTATITVFPMIVSYRPIGGLILSWNGTTAPAFDMTNIQIMANMVGVALNSLLEYQGQQAYLESLEYLGGLSTELNVLSTINQVANRTGHTACVLLKADHFAVLLLENQQVENVYTHHLSADFIEAMQQISLSNAASFEQEQTLIISDAGTIAIPEEWRSTFADESIQLGIGTLLSSHDRVFGYLWVFYDHLNTRTSYGVRLIEILAAQAAAALENIALNEANQEYAQILEERVAERTQELAVALDKAEDADRLKTKLLSTVSHELRTPLAVIKAHASTSLNYYDRLPKERHVQYLNTINEEANRLTEMITSLLEMSSLEAGMLDIHSVAFDPIYTLTQLLDRLRLRFADRALVATLPSMVAPVFADPERVRQLIANLLDNAAKYSPAGSAIEIGAKIWDDSLELWVKDHGKGLSPEQARQVFAPFYQVESLNSARSGVGLGLAICKGLVESMGGRIWCESNDINQGTRFAFTLPWASPELITNGTPVGANVPVPQMSTVTLRQDNVIIAD
ncbi:MAG: ATP-binding protein [Chloroflexota bacterium]